MTTEIELNVVESEKKRVRALHKLNVLDSQYEELYDSITQLAASITKMPVALITLIDEKRIWFKSIVGIKDLTETPRESRYCDLLVSSNEFVEIKDISKDEQHSQHPLINGETKYLYYAGAPIKLPLGEVVGVLCVFDSEPNKLNDLQIDVLIGLANVISKALVTKSFAKKVM